MPNRLMTATEVDESIKAFTKKLRDELAPAIAACKAEGMTDEQIALEINRELFDAFQGLHRFPRSMRP